MADRDSSPVYYREIQKHGYLKRMPDEVSGNKLRPLALKKPPLKPLWTQLCVHNGRTPYLEQYKDPVTTRAHRPVWRASLMTARHVTASVTPRDNEYDFLIDTDQGPVRMLAPTWECMQDWVSTLRNKLHELKIVSLCENVYMSPPAPPPPRAAARDPTSPLPPTPPLPPDRVPGIDLTSVTRPPPIPETPPEVITPEPSPPEEIDISNWDDLSLPSTSQAPTSVAKICGQNICLDDSIFKRNDSEDDTDCDSESSYRQTVVVGHSKAAEESSSDRPSNITVIQVSNKDAPHTAIPVIGSDTNVFDFNFKPTHPPDFINIVHTETEQSDYGTVFSENESDYGHLSLTTTVSLTGDVKTNEDLYERLCLATTKPSPLPVRKLRGENIRKSSLPNLDTVSSTYEYLFLSQNDSNNSNNVTYDNVTATSSIPISTENSAIPTHNTSTHITPISTHITPTQTHITPTQTHNTPTSTNTPISTHITPTPTHITPTSAHITPTSTHSIPISVSSTTITNTSNVTINSSTEVNSNRHVNSVSISNVDSSARGVRPNIERTQSQNSYDTSPRRERRNEGPKANGKVDKSDAQNKPIWKRGLTELSLLTRLRGIGHGKRSESPVRNVDTDRNGLSSPAKVVHRSRPEARLDRSRRRSSSLSNGQSPPSTSTPSMLQPLRARQASALIAAQRRGAAMVACVSTADPPVFADYNKQVWIAWWGGGGIRCAGRIGDRVCGLKAAAPKDAAHAKQLVHSTYAHGVDILFHRVPLAKIYVVTKRDQETIGIKLDNECNILSVESDSPAARAGIPPVGKWAVTEVNNRPVNLLKGGEDDMNRISLNGTEASVLIQPSALVKKLRTALKGNKTLLGLR